MHKKLNAVHMEPPGGRRRTCRAANVPTAESESSLSPVDADSSNDASGVGGSSECRRSSRKKTIKFDVRDLLNKNRKSHKIQIEARIDSNAPKVGAGQATKEELDSKQKNFIEKSAIFRRYSISENKLPPRPPPPPVSLIQTIQQCVGDFEPPPMDRDIATISPIVRRQSRTQDILTSNMIKPKQVSSLIVTKFESTSTTRTTPPNRAKAAPPKPPEVHTKLTLSTIQQKRRGRPPKFKAPGESSDITTDSSNDSFETSGTVRRETDTKPSTSRREPEKEGSSSDVREISLSPTSSTKGIDLREMLDASAVTLPQPTILDDCMLVSTDDIFVAAEEEVFTEALSSDESLRSSPKDTSNDDISLFARSNSTETNSSDDSETRRRKIRVSVKRVSLPSTIKENLDSNSKHSSDEKPSVIEIFSSNDDDSLRSREVFPKSPKIEDDSSQEGLKPVYTHASRKKQSLTPPAILTEDDNSNSTTLNSIVVISSASATPVEEMLKENAVSPTLRVTTTRRGRSCKRSEDEAEKCKNENQVSNMAFEEAITTIKPASPTYAQVGLRKRRSAPGHAEQPQQSTASQTIAVEETSSDHQCCPSPQEIMKNQLDAQGAEVIPPQNQTRSRSEAAHLTRSGVSTIQTIQSVTKVSAKNRRGASTQIYLSASKTTQQDAASPEQHTNEKEPSLNLETAKKEDEQARTSTQETRSKLANKRSAALLPQKKEPVQQSQTRDDPDDSQKSVQTLRTRSDVAQERFEQPQPNRKSAAVTLKYQKDIQQGSIANGNEATEQPSPTDPKVSTEDERAEGVHSKQNQRRGRSEVVQTKIDLPQASRRSAVFSSRNRKEPEQETAIQSEDQPTKQEEVPAQSSPANAADSLRIRKHPHEEVAPPKISLRSRKDAHAQVKSSQSSEAGGSVSRKRIEAVSESALACQASVKRPAEETISSKTTEESVQQSEKSIQKDTPEVTLPLRSEDSGPRSARSMYQKDTQIPAAPITIESPRILSEATLENEDQRRARLRNRLKIIQSEMQSDSAESVLSQTGGRPRSKSRNEVQNEQDVSKILNKQHQSDSSEETASSEKIVGPPARSARSRNRKEMPIEASLKSDLPGEAVSSQLIPSSEEESPPSRKSRVQKATKVRSVRSLSRTRSLRRHAANEQHHSDKLPVTDTSSSESSVSQSSEQKSESPLYQGAVPNVNETTKEEMSSTTITSESTDRSGTDTSSSGRRESLRAAIRASISPVKKMSTKRISKTLPKAVANDQTSSSSESSEHQDRMPKGRRQIRANDSNKSQEDTSSFCSESSSTASSSSTESSSSSSSASSSSSTSSSTSASSSSSSSAASEGRATRSRKALEVANGEPLESPRTTPPLVGKFSSENVSDAVEKKPRKSEEDFTEPDSESSENMAKLRPQLNSQSSKPEKDCDSEFKERAKVAHRRKSMRLNRWAATLEEETNETGSESSETSLPLRSTRSGRSRLRADVSGNAHTVDNKSSVPKNSADEVVPTVVVPPEEFPIENALKSVNDIFAQQSLDQPSTDEGKTTSDKAAVAPKKSKGRTRRFVPINDSLPRSNTFSDDNSSSSGTSSNTRLWRNTRARRRTISSAKELYELINPIPMTLQSSTYKSSENLKEIDDTLPSSEKVFELKARTVQESGSKQVQPETSVNLNTEVVVELNTELESKLDPKNDELASASNKSQYIDVIDIPKAKEPHKVDSDVQTAGKTHQKNETLSERSAMTPKQRKGNRFSLKNATEEVEPQEEIVSKSVELPKTPRQRKKAASTSKSPKSIATVITPNIEESTSASILTHKAEAISEKIISLPKESSPSTRSQRIAKKDAKPSKVEENSSIHISSVVSDFIPTANVVLSDRVAKPDEQMSVESNSSQKLEANTEKVVKRPLLCSSSSPSEEDIQKSIESDSISKAFEKLDANEEDLKRQLPGRSFGCRRSTPVKEDVQKIGEPDCRFISPAEPEDTPHKFVRKLMEGGSSTVPELNLTSVSMYTSVRHDKSPEVPASNSITTPRTVSAQVITHLEETIESVVEGSKIAAEPVLEIETIVNTINDAKEVSPQEAATETLVCLEKSQTKKEISPRKKKKALSQQPDTPKPIEEVQKSKKNKSSTETSTESEKPISSESNFSDDSQKVESKLTPHRQLDSSFIESLEKSLLRPVSTKKSSKKKEQIIVTSPSAKLKEEPQKLKKVQETGDEPKKPDTCSPKSKKKQKVDKKPDDDTPTKRKSLTKAKEQPIEAVKSLELDPSICDDTPMKRKSLTKAKEQPIEAVKSVEPDALICDDTPAKRKTFTKAKEQSIEAVKSVETDPPICDDTPAKRKSFTKAKEQPIEAVKSLEPDPSICEIPIAPPIIEPVQEALAMPVSIPKVMKSKGETKFYPAESVIDEKLPQTLVEARPTIAKEKSPDLLPDPLKDIEKFIEDGVNLLKRGYKLDDDDDTALDRDILKSDNLVTPKKCKLDDSIEEKKGSSPEDDNSNSNSECSTLTTTPTSEIDTPNGIRRSHRIKNSKSTKCLVGRGLVRDKERFSTKDDEKTIYSIDDQKMDLVEVEAKNSKFLKDMEERLSNFRVIRENEYKCERVISKEAKRMLCDCFLTAEEEERGELGCGEDCLNRLLMIECGSDCTVRYRCTNRRFTKFLYSPCRVFRTEKKGFGIMADIEILPGEFIMEYVGEVINGDEFEHRRNVYSQDKNKHYYFMALRSDAVIDATAKGNISRFINHSCDPNAETQKWTVNGELRIGFFSRKSIMPGEEITFDYQYQRYGKEAQKCFCESPNCRGWIGEEPSSEEEEEEEEEGESEETGDDEANEPVQPSIVPMPAIPTPIIVPDISVVEHLVPVVPILSEVSTIDKHMEPGVVVIPPVAVPSPIIPAEATSVDTDLQLKKKKDRKEEKIKRREAKQFLEDPDIEDEVRFLVKCGLKNQADTLRLSRLIVRAKLLETRLKLLQILRNGELPCRRLFLDYHGLRLLHGWMSDVVDTRETDKSMEIRMVLLSVLECLPISNKTMLTDSKVYQTVRDWSNNKESHSPSEDSPKESTAPSSTSPTGPEDPSSELQRLAAKLVNTWDSLPEVFRIPKRERIEQMKEHEREADKGLGQNISRLSGHRNRERFMRNSGPNSGRFKWSRSEKDKERERAGDRRRYAQNNNGSGKDDKSVPGESQLSKEQRRELFAAKVARDEAEKRLAEERREFDIKCRFFGLDPKRMRPENMPFCVNPSTGQWYSTDKKPISTPPSYAHVQVPVKPKSTNPEDYRLPPMDLPPLWKFAISPKGKIYYYHVKIRIPQWEPPIKILPLAGQTSASVKNSESDSSTGEGIDSSEDDIDIIKGLDPVKLQAYIEKKIEDRRLQRYTRLVIEKPISPRKEEDRIYNQMEVRKYKENKEKIRKRKEDIRRRGEPSSKTVDVKPSETNEEDETPANALPIQDFLLSSDEDVNIKAECNNSPLIEKIVQGDKIVDELDALHSKRSLKRPLAIREKYEHKKRKQDKKDSSKSTKRSKDGEGSSSSSKYRKIKEKFRCEIAGIIVHHLKPYRKETCLSGRVLTDDDFNHLARKLTHFVMVKEMKYCESIGQTLVVTESVKNKSREFIKKYMAKYGGVYVRPNNDPEYKEIPFL